MEGFQWLNESKMTETAQGITLYATEKSDYFRNGDVVGENGITPESYGNAPFYYTEVTGDFVMRAKVSVPFRDTYDSACLMIMESDEIWAKACFELTDFGTRAVVSVVTNGISDDANGCNVEADALWLQICRVRNSFGIQYSLDGKRFDMMRYFSLPVGETIKAGMLAQAPTGAGGERHFEDFVIEHKTVANLRAGV